MFFHKNCIKYAKLSNVYGNIFRLNNMAEPIVNGPAMNIQTYIQTVKQLYINCHMLKQDMYNATLYYAGLAKFTSTLVLQFKYTNKNL